MVLRELNHLSIVHKGHLLPVPTGLSGEGVEGKGVSVSAIGRVVYRQDKIQTTHAHAQDLYAHAFIRTR